MPEHTAPLAPAHPQTALRHPGFRAFFILVAMVMTADFVEHVISYWVIFQKFHSTWLAGFAVFSHWVPFLVLSIYSGSLSDRFDIRRIVQIAMLIFMSVSIAWGVLFYTGKLQIWHAGLLLVIHGMAGVLWNPAAQLLLHDIVGPTQLQSAVRLTATARNLGMLVGPGLGSALLLWLGPTHGIFLNALIYLPMILWMWKAPYGPRFRKGAPAPVRAVRGLADIADTLRTVAASRTLLSMMLLAAGASFFIGNAYQAQMPELANDLHHGDPGLSYGLLLGADAIGALIAAVVLESRGLLPPSPRTAIILAMLWCCALAGFALAKMYALAICLLLVAGFVELAFNSMAQTIVQLNAPPALRGRIIGVFIMSSLGMRTFSGLTVGMVGAVIGIHYSLALSACVLLLIIGSLLFMYSRSEPPRQ
ncbi:MAG: MFS transporter [Gammaproteobacteria bacterium]